MNKALELLQKSLQNLTQQLQSDLNTYELKRNETALLSENLKKTRQDLADIEEAIQKLSAPKSKKSKSEASNASKN